MTKDIRDICLTIGTIALFTVSALFLCTLITTLKLGKIALLITAVSVLLIIFGLSSENRYRIKSLMTANGLY